MEALSEVVMYWGQLPLVQPLGEGLVLVPQLAQDQWAEHQQTADEACQLEPEGFELPEASL